MRSNGVTCLLNIALIHMLYSQAKHSNSNDCYEMTIVQPRIVCVNGFWSYTFCGKNRENIFLRTLCTNRFNENSILFPFLSVDSTESGWDNPFRPGGDLSREADEIVNLIKGNFLDHIRHLCFLFIIFLFSWIIGGKPITPNDINDSLLNGNTQINGHSPENGALTETVTKTEVNLP